MGDRRLLGACFAASLCETKSSNPPREDTEDCDWCVEEDLNDVENEELESVSLAGSASSRAAD